MNTLGKMLTGASLIAAGCAPPAYQAKQDYGIGHDSGVALYNIQQILADKCDGGGFANEQGLSCTFTKITNQITTRTTYGHSVSGDLETKTVSFDWAEVDTVENPSCQGCFWINFSLKDGRKTYLPTRNTQQTGELEQAVRIYLRERNQ